VKSDRAVILVNLSLALLISYIIFIAGVDRTENKVSVEREVNKQGNT